MYKVAVLLSTYNGERFLREQLDSILSQKDVLVDLYIRDDGSKDKTIKIIRDYSENYSNIVLTEGENVGVGNSFMELVCSAGDADFYAFSDQDDVWLPNKLICAIDRLSQLEGPVLYTSNQTLVDKELKEIGIRYKTAPDISYKQNICHNNIPGCTMVWNKKLQQILSCDKRRPSSSLLRKRIHDAWVMMAAAVSGKILYDSGSHILYRQHETNVIGVRKTSIFKKWKQKIADPSQRNGRSDLCKEIYDKFSDIATVSFSDMEVYAHYKNSFRKKLQLLNDSSIIKKSEETRLGFSLKVLFNLF